MPLARLKARCFALSLADSGAGGSHGQLHLRQEGLGLASLACAGSTARTLRLAQLNVYALPWCAAWALGHFSAS